MYLVVWECSMTLTEMQDYIKKTTMKDEEEEGGKEVVFVNAHMISHDCC